MKKNLIILSVLALMCAGAVLVGCPSASTPGKEVANPDMIFLGGKYRYTFTQPRIEHDKEYEVILTIDECDDDFIGSRLGGKICYKMDINDDTPGAEKVLSGWLIAVPPTVSEIPRTYKWTFKAGAANSDDVTIENPANTPEGAAQYFSLTAQNGYTDWAQTDPDIEFKIKGKFEVRPKQIITSWVSAGEVTLGSQDGTAGKGPLSDEDMAIIRGLPDGSVIEFTVHVTVNNSNARPGYGVCGVGGWETTNSMSIPVPGDAELGELTFIYRLVISDILSLQPAGYQIAVNPYNGATVTKAELFKPGP